MTPGPAPELNQHTTGQILIFYIIPSQYIADQSPQEYYIYIYIYAPEEWASCKIWTHATKLTVNIERSVVQIWISKGASLEFDYLKEYT